MDATKKMPQVISHNAFLIIDTIAIPLVVPNTWNHSPRVSAGYYVASLQGDKREFFRADFPDPFFLKSNHCQKVAEYVAKWYGEVAQALTDVSDKIQYKRNGYLLFVGPNYAIRAFKISGVWPHIADGGGIEFSKDGPFILPEIQFNAARAVSVFF